MMPAAVAAGSAPEAVALASVTTGRIFAFGAMPAMPVPNPCPAMSTDIMVPWPSFAVSKSVLPLLWRPVTSPPGRTAPRRSGTLACTPLSSTATVTPAPWVSGHTLGRIFHVVNHHSPARGLRPARPSCRA